MPRPFQRPILEVLQRVEFFSDDTEIAKNRFSTSFKYICMPNFHLLIIEKLAVYPFNEQGGREVLIESCISPKEKNQLSPEKKEY